MEILTIIALLHLSLSATAVLLSNGSAETELTAALGDIVLLPCYTVGNVTPTSTVWMKDGREIISGGSSSPIPSPTERRLMVLSDGSLSISRVLPEDEGSYLCNSMLPGNVSFQARLLLHVTRDLENVSTSIGPATALPNGTLFTYQDTDISFNCSGSSDPSWHLTWSFKGDSASNESLVSTSGSWLELMIENIQPSNQGVYSCRAHNNISEDAVSKSTELLVYYVSDRHPECMWAPVLDPSHVQFNCSWFGAYPTPSLSWGDDQGDQENQIFASEVTDNLVVTLNRSLLSDGETLKCMAQHQGLAPGREASCLFTFKLPFPEGEPLANAQVGSSITLTCTECMSLPPASNTWRKGLKQEEIVLGSKYVISEEGPVLKLTILNISKDDEGVYFCRSENALAVRELEVYLTVRNSSPYTGVIIGIFIAALIAGLAAVIANTVYSSRHQICLGGGFGRLENDRGDVLSLVESDDEQIFQDTVPRLPPLPNRRDTTLVQIHTIPSSERDDVENGDMGPEQNGKTAQTEEPVDLLNF